ncbi:hypothetical protein [Kribbella sp. NPDC023855]|uniref:hypothetical protein n=1 Tax=Kribbella sp. NPDC023855 TaxID=3154698 RepID=UPI0033F33ADD
MRRWVRRTVLLIVLGIVGVGVMPAHAGGPTSVLLSASDVGKVVATGYQDKAYEELRRLLDTQAAGEAGPHDIGPAIRATWLIHDVTPWRTDVIYPDAPGGPWISTVLDLDSADGLTGARFWHRAADSVQLIKLLVSLDLLHGKPANGRQPTTAPATTAPPTTAPATTEPATTEPGATAPVVPEPDGAAAGDTPVTALKIEEKPLLGWRWSIPGFLLGAAAAYLALRYLPRRNWQLIDEE